MIGLKDPVLLLEACRKRSKLEFVIQEYFEKVNPASKSRLF